MKPYQKLRIFSSSVLEMKINEPNKMTVLSSSDGDLVVYDLNGTRMIFSTKNEGVIYTVAFD